LHRRGFLRLLAGAIVAACTQALPLKSPTSPTPTGNPTTSSSRTTTPTIQPTDSVPPPPTPTPASTANVVYRGGTILTMDPDLPRVSAIAILGERILAVGDEAAVNRYIGESTAVVDLQGKTLIPGFNDAHCHRIGDRDVWGLATAEEAIARTLAQGFTSISELFVNQERLDELVALDQAGSLKLRVNAYLPVNYLEQKFGVWFGHLQPHQQMSPRVRIGGVKAFADKASSNEAWITTDYPDQPGYRGDIFWAENELIDLLKPLHEDGWQVAVHTAGDAAHDMVLDAFERALAGAPNTARHRIEHVMLVRDDQIARMSAMGIVASFQLGWFTTLWTDDWERVPAWPDQAGRWRHLINAGVPAVGSTDCPWAPPVGPAMRALESAVTRRNEGAGRAPEWQARQRLTIDEALNLLTARGAWATFEETEKGMLRPGMLADLVIMSEDPTQVATTLLSEIDVLATIIGGVGEYCPAGSESLCP
jgi:predicted amidohydrolase YtcJ